MPEMCRICKEKEARGLAFDLCWDCTRKKKHSLLAKYYYRTHAERIYERIKNRLKNPEYRKKWNARQVEYRKKRKEKDNNVRM